MEPTPEIVEEVLNSYRRLRSPYKVARECGYEPRVVWSIIDQHADTVALPQERFGGEGRPEMHIYLVARMKPGASGWDNEDGSIALARQRYCDGTHDMATGRDGRWLLLYSIPLKKAISARPDFFKNRSY